jgi:NTE family protein
MGFFDIMNQSISMGQVRLAQLLIEKYPPDLLVNISKQAAGTFEFYRAKELIALGRSVAKEAIKEQLTKSHELESHQ